MSPQRLRVDVTDRQPRTAWLDTLHSWEATKTETEQKAMEEYSEGGGEADERTFSGRRSAREIKQDKKSEQKKKKTLDMKEK